MGTLFNLSDTAAFTSSSNRTSTALQVQFHSKLWSLLSSSHVLGGGRERGWGGRQQTVCCLCLCGSVYPL